MSDAGRSLGGFQYNAEWNATLVVENARGTLKLVLDTGLGDALTKHEYLVSDFIVDANKINMRIDGQPVVLIWIENEVVWEHAYDRQYIASWGSDARLKKLE